MFKNYLKIGWRTIKNHKLFSVINILGLSIGITTCFIILLYVQNELSYDRYNKNADNIFRIYFKANMDGGKISESGVMPPVASTLKNDFPQVIDATRLQPQGAQKITFDEKEFKDDRYALVDQNFFKIFTLPMIEGDPATALSQPNTVVITKTTAQKYFGKKEAVGRILTFNDKVAYKVTGVINDVPSNSHFHFDIFGAMVGNDIAKSDSWMFGNFYTYLLLKPGTNYKNLEAQFPSMVEKYMGPQIQQQMGLSLQQFRTKGNELGFALQPLKDIHLHPLTTNELEPAGNASYVYIFAAIAIFMLLIACINFINLSTASASKRAKEVGVRKVAGSGKMQLVTQFLTESLLIAVLATLLAMVFAYLVLPAFNNLSGKELALTLKPVVAFILLGLVVGVIAGIYPAFYLSSFKPITVLKGKFTGDRTNFSIRSGLVVFQFFISVALIIATVVVYQQMEYIQNKNLGYNKEQILTIPNSYALAKNEPVFKQQMLQDSRIENATVSSYKPAGPTNSNNALAYPAGHDDQAMRTVEYHVDEQYIPTFGMHIETGRNFSSKLATDSSAMIINETAAKAFGWNSNTAIGKTLIRVNSDRGNNASFHIIGVIRDFNFKSLHEPITPLLMTIEPDGGLIFKIRTADIPGLLTTMKKNWDSFNTGEPFTYAFMDDLFNKTYATEHKTGVILNLFSLLTIFLACLGLFGLATYTAEQRTKEIGIRKVLGASVSQIMQMLSKEFMRWVLIASLIAFPVAWWGMNKWLQSFAYRIDIRWWVFGIAVFAALLIAFITISFQAIKAARANPVKNLRTE